MTVTPELRRDGLLQKCPECGDHFLYQSAFEFRVSGSEDEQGLTRVVLCQP